MFAIVASAIYPPSGGSMQRQGRAENQSAM
jgi:hypothetical protein